MPNKSDYTMKWYYQLIRPFIGEKVNSMGREIWREYNRLIISTKLENSPIYTESFAILLKLANISINSSNIHVLILFHSIIMNSHLLSSKKLESIHIISSILEKNPNWNIIHALNTQSNALFEERQLFHDSLQKMNVFMDIVSRRLLFLSSSLLAVMVSLALLIGLLVLSITLPPELWPFHLSRFIPKAFLFDAITSITAMELSSSTIFAQLIIVLFVLLAGSGGYIIGMLQQTYLKECIREAIRKDVNPVHQVNGMSRIRKLVYVTLGMILMIAVIYYLDVYETISVYSISFLIKA